MPGRLVMDQEGAIASEGSGKEKEHVQNGIAHGALAVEQQASAPDSMQVNGTVDSNREGESMLPNGVSAKNGGLPTTNGNHSDVTMALSDSDDPPQLDQSWRQTDHNKSLGKLMERLSQQCFWDLKATIAKMSDSSIEAAAAAPQPSITAPALTGPDTSASSLNKKRAMLDFANDQRDRFTKTLVLSDWAHKAPDMARLIDIKVWQEKQRFAYQAAATSIGETKRRTIGFKEPAPNLEGAMELLATGKAAGVPDMGYLPTKRLTAKQLLRTLKDMNVILATRLNLHEEIPYYMQEYNVANGRVTFRVPGEFEVDLTVADEDLTKQFYFIDIRFLFTPSPGVLSEAFRMPLEHKTNEALLAKGLQGCYEVLHSFVLTHKINTLLSQASGLIRGRWFDCIKVENLRRNMTVQYWSGMPGPKSWFEIGISSGKQHARSWRKGTPYLSVRWFRRGQEVTNERLDFDWEKLDPEACLLEVISRHCFGKLSVLRAGVLELSGGSAALQMRLSGDKGPPNEMTLTLGLPSMKSPVTVRLEPVKGHYSIAPPNASTARTENRLNRDSNADAPRLLCSLLCMTVQNQVRKQAELLEWREVQNLSTNPTDFGGQWWHRSAFQLPGWGAEWALAVSFHLTGEKWWILQLTDDTSEGPNPVPVRRATNIQPLDVLDASKQSPGISRASLLRIARSAVAEVSYVVLAHELRDSHIPHRVEKLALTEYEDLARWRKHSSMFVRFSTLMKEGREKTQKSWASDFLRVSHHGIVESTVDEAAAASVRHDLRLSLEPGGMKYLQQHLTKARDQDIALNATGGLAVKLSTPFGTHFVQQIQHRLRNIHRLDRNVAILQHLTFTCTAVSLTKLAFTYSATPLLSAHLTFSHDGSLPVRLRLEPRDTNPHLRIQTALERSLNQNDDHAFSNFAHALALTLPVLNTFSRFETAHLDRPRSFTIHVRSATWYHLVYASPYSAIRFELRTRSKVVGGEKTVVKWHLAVVKHEKDVHGPTPPEYPADFAAGLKGFWSESGDGWMGVGNGVVADAEGVARAVEGLDGVIRRFEMVVEGEGKGAEGKREERRDVIMLD